MKEKKIGLRYHGLFFRLTGTREAGFHTSSATAGELLGELTALHGSPFRDLVFKDGQLSDRVVVLLNGRNIFHLEGEQTVLAEGDTLQLLTQVAGG